MQPSQQPLVDSLLSHSTGDCNVSKPSCGYRSYSINKRNTNPRYNNTYKTHKEIAMERNHVIAMEDTKIILHDALIHPLYDYSSCHREYNSWCFIFMHYSCNNNALANCGQFMYYNFKRIIECSFFPKQNYRNGIESFISYNQTSQFTILLFNVNIQ